MPGKTRFRGGGDIRCRSNSSGRIHRQKPNFARRLKIGDLVGHVDDDHLDLAAEKIGKRRSCSLIRDADDIKASCKQFEHFAGKKRVRSRTAVAKRDLAGFARA